MNKRYYRYCEEEVHTLNYGAILDDMLRDGMVCGINNASIQLRLLSEQGLTFEMTLGMETTARNVQTLQKSSGATVSTAENSDSSETPVHKFRRRASPGPERKPVTAVVKGGHSSNKCCLKGAYCHACGKMGHIAPVCKSAHSGKSCTMQVRKK